MTARPQTPILDQTADGQALAGVPCSALAPMSFAAALESLPKKELIRLLTAAGQPPRIARDRERSLLATRLARYADKITIVVEWDSRMPNDLRERPATPDSRQPETL